LPEIYTGKTGELKLTFKKSISGVQSITLTVRKPDNMIVVWSIDPGDIDEENDTATYTLQSTDLNIAGNYQIGVDLVFADKTAYQIFNLHVYDKVDKKKVSIQEIQ